MDNDAKTRRGDSALDPSGNRKDLDSDARRELAEKIVVALREIGLACELIAAEAGRSASEPEPDERRALIRDLARYCRPGPEA